MKGHGLLADHDPHTLPVLPAHRLWVGLEAGKIGTAVVAGIAVVVRHLQGSST